MHTVNSHLRLQLSRSFATKNVTVQLQPCLVGRSPLLEQKVLSGRKRFRHTCPLIIYTAGSLHVGARDRKPQGARLKSDGSNKCWKTDTRDLTPLLQDCQYSKPPIPSCCNGNKAPLTRRLTWAYKVCTQSLRGVFIVYNSFEQLNWKRLRERLRSLKPYAMADTNIP